MMVNNFPSCCGSLILSGFSDAHYPMDTDKKEAMKKFLINTVYLHRSKCVFVTTLNDTQWKNAHDVFEDCGFKSMGVEKNRNSGNRVHLVARILGSDEAGEIAPYRKASPAQIKAYWQKTATAAGR